jgi:hypothetical protein
MGLFRTSGVSLGSHGVVRGEVDGVASNDHFSQVLESVSLLRLALSVELLVGLGWHVPFLFVRNEARIGNNGQVYRYQEVEGTKEKEEGQVSVGNAVLLEVLDGLPHVGHADDGEEIAFD